MNPQQPQYIAPSPKKHKTAALILLILPSVLLLLAFLFAILAGQAATTTNDGLFAETNATQQTLTMFAFICGGVGFISWLPGIIIGSILLARKK